MESKTSLPAIVIDNGSFMVKAGFADSDAPRAVFRNLVGRPRRRDGNLSLGSKDAYVGDEGVSERSLNIKCPMENGIVINWDDMEVIWHHTFYKELRASPEDRAVLLTESPFNPRQNREKMTQIMFETFNTPSMYLKDRASLSLMASGSTRTGVVVRIGDASSYAVPIYENQAIAHAAISISICGRHITQYLSTLLEQEGTVESLTTSAERETVRYIKERLCYVALDFEKEMETSISSSALEKSYEMPSGSEILIASQRFRAPEALFQPSFLKIDKATSPQRAIFDAIAKCDAEIQEQLRQNVVLAGGSTMFDGFSNRLEKELSSLLGYSSLPRVAAPPYRAYTAWSVGALFASQSVFPELCITKDHYDEHGPQVCHLMRVQTP